MDARELMTANPEACLPTDTCAVAAGIMRRRSCGFVPVVESQETRRVIGVVTDRDLALHLVQADRRAGEVPVSACMTREVRMVAPDAELEEIAGTMEAAAVHRVPVVEDGRLVGVLSVSDMARAASQEWAKPGPHGSTAAGYSRSDRLGAVRAEQGAHTDSVLYDGRHGRPLIGQVSFGSSRSWEDRTMEGRRGQADVQENGDPP